MNQTISAIKFTSILVRWHVPYVQVTISGLDLTMRFHFLKPFLHILSLNPYIIIGAY